MLGYCDIGSWRIETAPRMTMMIAMTLAKIGRSMKNFDMGVALPGYWLFGGASEPFVASGSTA